MKGSNVHGLAPSPAPNGRLSRRECEDTLSSRIAWLALSIVVLGLLPIGCAAPARMAAMHSQVKQVDANQGQQSEVTTGPYSEQAIAPVSYVDDTTTCSSENATCEPPMSNGSCAVCQSDEACGCQPMGVLPYPNVYFNPYLIDPNEFICDGGDNQPAVRVQLNDDLIGIDLEDTVVRYTTDAGDTLVQPSNKVCLYAPRFASVRRVSGAESGELAVGAIGVEQPLGPVRAQLNQPGLAVTGRDRPVRGAAVRGPDAMRERNRGVPIERVLQPELAEDVLAILANLTYLNRGLIRDAEKPWLSMAAQAAVIWSIEEEVAVTVNELAPVTLTRDLSAEEMVVYDFPDAGRLRICKLADKCAAQPGDVVTFMIRVDNIGDSTVHKVLITDNLITRLEYIADSQKCTTKANFTTTQNEGESLQLSWSLENDLKVGEGATIEFKCKVR